MPLPSREIAASFVRAHRQIVTVAAAAAAAVIVGPSDHPRRARGPSSVVRPFASVMPPDPFGGLLAPPRLGRPLSLRFALLLMSSFDAATATLRARRGLPRQPRERGPGASRRKLCSVVKCERGREHSLCRK